jgi:hypothetical protein
MSLEGIPEGGSITFGLCGVGAEITVFPTFPTPLSGIAWVWQSYEIQGRSCGSPTGEFAPVKVKK